MKIVFFESTVTLLVVLCLPSSGYSTSKIRNQITCYNNGTLVEDGADTWCDCPDPFTGKHCEDYACVNGLSTGLQYDPDNLFFNKRCLCDSGWTGELCDKLKISHCGENGEDLHGKCVCQQNFAGDRCQYVTKCIYGQLYAGRCACHYGWSGDFCDIIICHGGTPDEDYKSCICPSRYRGKYCDFCAEPSSSPPPQCAAIGKEVVSVSSAANEKGVVDVSSDRMPVLFAVIITLGIAALLAIVYFICRKMKELQNARIPVRRRRTNREENQFTNTNEHEMEAMNLQEYLTKHDEPPKYEDIMPNNSNYLPTSQAVIEDESDTIEINFHQNKSMNP